MSFGFEKVEDQSMRAPRELAVSHHRDHPEIQTSASSQYEHNMQDSRPQASQISEETSLIAPNVSIEDASEDGVNPRGESQASLAEQLANLALSSSVPSRSPSLLLSPDHPLQSVEVAEPITVTGPTTVRDLSNATPRPSPSPEPRTQLAPTAYSDLRSAQEEAVDEPNIPATEEDFNIPDFEDEPMLYEVLDEPLPPGPFSDRDYQNALKSAKALTGDILQKLSRCEWSARPGTQLYKIKQRAEALNKLDNPASRTIGIVGDSAAGKR